jgi:hypothetical protein
MLENRLTQRAADRLRRGPQWLVGRKVIFESVVLFKSAAGVPFGENQPNR